MTQQERDAWALAYKLYDEFAKKLRQAATLDDAGKTARALFETIQERLRVFYNANGADARLLSVATYGILEQVYREAKNKAAGALQCRTKGNVLPDERTRQSA